MDDSVLRKTLRDLDPRPGDRVLVLRCATINLTARLLEALLEEHPGIVVDLLAQNAFLPYIKDKRTNPLIVRDGELCLDLIEPETLRAIRSREYRVGLVPYNTIEGSGYDNVHALAFQLSDCPFVGVGSDGRGRPIPREPSDIGARPVDSRLAGLKDKHAGRRAFVLGNGRSLRIADLDRLGAEITFASNKIYLAFEQTDWRPTYYTVDDAMVAENNAEAIRALELRKIFGEVVKPLFPEDDDVIYMNELRNPTPKGKADYQFSTDLLRGAHAGCSVIHKQLQLAFFLGIRHVHLLGMDFQFSVPEAKGAWTTSGQAVVSQGERNHFHPDYRRPGEVWTVPNLEGQRAAFARARETFEAHGGWIRNASRFTELDVFPREDFDAIDFPV